MLYEVITRFGEDDNTFAVGWNIDNVSVARNRKCEFAANNAPYDFDNDGRTDASVFRPIGAALTSNGAPEGT